MITIIIITIKCIYQIEMKLGEFGLPNWPNMQFNFRGCSCCGCQVIRAQKNCNVSYKGTKSGSFDLEVVDRFK